MEASSAKSATHQSDAKRVDFCFLPVEILEQVEEAALHHPFARENVGGVDNEFTDLRSKEHFCFSRFLFLLSRGFDASVVTSSNRVGTHTRTQVIYIVPVSRVVLYR